MNIFGLILTLFGLWALPAVVLAHCPLCTAGAGAAALGASTLGVGSGSIGIFIGAFGLAMGLWIGKMISKSYILHQKWILGIGSFLLTVLPLTPLFPEAIPVSIAIAGEYGTLLHRVYAPNLFVIGSVIGGLLLAASPVISGKIRIKRGKRIPYQGLLVTFGLLIIAAALIELWV